MVLWEWLRIKGPDFYHDGNFIPVQIWERCISVFGDYAAK